MFDELMRRGWPALAESDLDGWLARVSGGVTQRANSVASLAEPADVDAAVSAVERLYAEHGLPAVFQVGPTARPADLDARLAARGYEFGSPTVFEVAETAAVLARLPAHPVPVTLADEPDESWMDLWWRVDGRGGADARAVARAILTGGPARYAAVDGPHGALAVARLALVGEWGGLYCLAVHPAARRRGLGTAVTRALLADAAPAGVSRCWLQVRAENAAALALYEAAGFTPAARYHYRTSPPPRDS
ncbi:GNAT family N-acetyltransferase [Actinophytocola xanthii]|nr:GNAT family N-acetyltransferase [Actinophytocola xanthii]